MFLLDIINVFRKDIWYFIDKEFVGYVVFLEVRVVKKYLIIIFWILKNIEFEVIKIKINWKWSLVVILKFNNKI